LSRGEATTAKGETRGGASGCLLMAQWPATRRKWLVVASASAASSWAVDWHGEEEEEEEESLYLVFFVCFVHDSQ